MPTNRRPSGPSKLPTWSAAEIEACLELYETRSAEETARELHRRGLSPIVRSAGSIRQVAASNGRASEQILELVRDYAGMPLSYRDLEEEIGLSRKRVQALTRPLVRRGALEELEGENRQKLVRDPIAWREATA